MKSALEKRYAGLDGRDDHMFVGFRSTISIRLEVSEPCVCDPEVGLDVYGYLLRSGRLMRSGRTGYIFALPPAYYFPKLIRNAKPNQIRTLNHCHPPGNINRSKLATELAKSVQRFSKVCSLLWLRVDFPGLSFPLRFIIESGRCSPRSHVGDVLLQRRAS